MNPAGLRAQAHLPHRLQKSANASSASDRRLINAAAFLGIFGNFAINLKSPCVASNSRMAPTNSRLHFSGSPYSGLVQRKAKNNSPIFSPTFVKSEKANDENFSWVRKCTYRLNEFGRSEPGLISVLTRRTAEMFAPFISTWNAAFSVRTTLAINQATVGAT